MSTMPWQDRQAAALAAIGDAEYVPYYDGFEVAACMAIAPGGEELTVDLWLALPQLNPSDVCLERADGIYSDNLVMDTVYGHQPQGGVEALVDIMVVPGKLTVKEAYARARSIAHALANTEKGVPVMEW